LSGYLYPFKRTDESFKEDTTLDMVWENYCFDRQLRLLVMDACERFETALKTDIVYHFAQKCGAFGYLDYKNLSGIKPYIHTKLLEKIKDETTRSKEIFVVHFFKKYGDKHSFLPLWMVAEVLSFGSIHTMYKGLSPQLKQTIAKKYNISDKVLLSWIGTIQVIRNICAHHGRIYNSILGVKPLIPNKNPLWHTPETIDNSRIFSVLTILNYLLRIIAPHSEWKQRIYSLLQKYNQIPRSVMGFTNKWTDNELWKDLK
jgi:abortive infection bacteriophage resistance protein